MLIPHILSFGYLLLQNDEDREEEVNQLEGGESNFVTEPEKLEFVPMELCTYQTISSKVAISQVAESKEPPFVLPVPIEMR